MADIKIHSVEFESGQEPEDTFDGDFATSFDVEFTLSGRILAQMLGVQMRVLDRAVSKLDDKKVIGRFQNSDRTMDAVIKAAKPEINRLMKNLAYDLGAEGLHVLVVEFYTDSYYWEASVDKRKGTVKIESVVTVMGDWESSGGRLASNTRSKAVSRQARRVASRWLAVHAARRVASRWLSARSYDDYVADKKSKGEEAKSKADWEAWGKSQDKLKEQKIDVKKLRKNLPESFTDKMFEDMVGSVHKMDDKQLSELKELASDDTVDPKAVAAWGQENLPDNVKSWLSDNVKDEADDEEAADMADHFAVSLLDWFGGFVSDHK